MQTDLYKKIVDLIEESKCSNSFDDISTKIMLKNILNRLNEIEYLAKQNNIKDKKC